MPPTGTCTYSSDCSFEYFTAISAIFAAFAISINMTVRNLAGNCSREIHCFLRRMQSLLTVKLDGPCSQNPDQHMHFGTFKGSAELTHY